MEQLLEVARARALLRDGELTLCLLGVLGALHIAEHTDRRRHMHARRQTGEREGEGRILACLVVNQDGVLAYRGDVDDLQALRLMTPALCRTERMVTCSSRMSG